MPAVINPEGSFRIDIDLAEHFDFPKPGIYGLNVGVTTPNGEVLRSTVPLQLTDGSAPANERPRPGQRPTGELAADLAVPSPEVYVPGQPVNGINMLLRPVKSEYEVGEPIKVELRLTNVDERKQSMNIDIRLERTLMVHVKEQGDSPVVRPFIQRITWNDKPTDGAALPYAMLRPDSFWGKTININSLYGVDTTELLVSSVDPTKLLDSQLNYERLGMTLFSFDKPGVYRVDATYFVQPRPGDLRVWAGKLTSNHVFIRVKPGSAIGQVPR